LTEESGFYARQLNCKHEQNLWYTRQQFDILNGLEYTLTRCLNCHKIVKMSAKKLAEA